MISFLYGNDIYVSKWVAEKIGNPSFGVCSTIGILKGPLLIAGIVYSNYIVSPAGMPIMCEVSCAAIDKTWANRYTLNALFSYPFTELAVGRLQVTIPTESKKVIKFNEKLGFQHEGIARKAHFLGGDVVIMSMLRDECRWL